MLTSCSWIKSVHKNSVNIFPKMCVVLDQTRKQGVYGVFFYMGVTGSFQHGARSEQRSMKCTLCGFSPPSTAQGVRGNKTVVQSKPCSPRLSKHIYVFFTLPVNIYSTYYVPRTIWRLSHILKHIFNATLKDGRVGQH